MLKFIKLLVVFFALILVNGCGVESKTPTFHEDNNPELLSDWGQFTLSQATLSLNENVNSYELNTALFSDYAHKLRTVWTPNGTMQGINSEGTYEFPHGTVISKTFYYPKNAHSDIALIEQNNKLTSIVLRNYQLIETRLLIKRNKDWVALPYVWNKEQNEARLQRFGEVIPLSGLDKNKQVHDFNYLVPDVNQCAACHQWDMEKALQPIGLQPRHLNTDHSFEKYLNEISHTNTHNDSTQSFFTLNAKARSYLDINCSHCHSPVGPANTSGLHLESYRPLGIELGLCKLPIAAGKGTGGHTFDIDPGDSEHSIFTYRLQSTDPASMMPELGRSLVHQEGLELITTWIDRLEGHCRAN